MAILVNHEIVMLNSVTWRVIADVIFGQNLCVRIFYLTNNKVATALSIEEAGSLLVNLVFFERLGNGVVVVKGSCENRLAMSIYIEKDSQKLFVRLLKPPLPNK